MHDSEQRELHGLPGDVVSVSLHLWMLTFARKVGLRVQSFRAMSSDVLKIALVQLNVTDDVKQNTETVVNYVREAKEKGAEFVFTPENTDYMKAPPPKDGSAHTSSTSTAMLEDQHITLEALRR